VTEVTLEATARLLSEAMNVGKGRSTLRSPRRADIEQLAMMTGLLIEAYETDQQLNGWICRADELLSSLSEIQRFARDRGSPEIADEFHRAFETLRSEAPSLTDLMALKTEREYITTSGYSRIAVLAEGLTLAARVSLAPANGTRAPSMIGDNAATRYAAAWIQKVTNKPTTAGSVKLHCIRLEGARAKRKK